MTLRMGQTDDACFLHMRGSTHYMDMIVQHKIIHGRWLIACKSTPDLGLGLVSSWRHHKDTIKLPKLWVIPLYNVYKFKELQRIIKTYAAFHEKQENKTKTQSV